MINGRGLPVRGQAWMDHEISSSQLGEDQAGWDWAGIQLNDGREIMTYRLRKKDGSTDPFSSLAWVDKRGVVTNLTQAQFEWTAIGTWTSPATGGVYPVDVKLTTSDPATGRRVTFLLRPLAKDQELSATPGGVSYWEGACRVLDETGTRWDRPTWS